MKKNENENISCDISFDVISVSNYAKIDVISVLM